MPLINSGISFYPSGFDLKASGSTMFYVADESRDVFTGNIVSSGDIIIGLNVNTAFTALDSIERTLGLNPQGAFATVGSRILNLENTIGISGASLIMASGTNILTAVSGVGNIGIQSTPFNNIAVNSISGNARLQVAHAWANVSGVGAAVIQDSFGVSSASRVSTGLYNIYWSVPFSNSLYSVVATATSPSSNSNYTVTIWGMSGTGVQLNCTNLSSPTDTNALCVTAFGRI